MATAKYKAESPFVKQAERNHHTSDFLYDRYKELIPSILILVRFLIFNTNFVLFEHRAPTASMFKIKITYLFRSHIDPDCEAW